MQISDAASNVKKSTIGANKILGKLNLKIKDLNYFFVKLKPWLL